MRIIRKLLVVFLCLGSFVYMDSLLSDKQQLRDQVLRLHVVANSDSEADQAVKLQVRDAVLAVVDEVTAGADSKKEAQRLLEQNLTGLEAAADRVLEQAGMTDRTKVTLCQENFSTREYDTFTLPAGVYDSLRVTIGSGAGRNWWCVVFPGLCIPAASDGVADTAAGAGFSDSLTGSITGQPRYEVRFFLLDWLGRLENFFHNP